MAYTYTDGMDPAKPAGSDTANVDDDIRGWKLALEERFVDVFGLVGLDDDPWVLTKFTDGISIQGLQVGTPIYDAGNSGAAKTIDWDNGDQQKVTLTANCTLTFSNVIAGRSYQLFIVQNGTGGYSITFPATVFQSGNSAFGTPSLTTTASRHSLVALSCFSTAVQIATVVYTGVRIS